MASEMPPNDPWDRVASELRAYREAQQQAWGEIDNATLGRYIAGDLGGEEIRQIEQALVERPELRKLTDLVRDVLADFEPAAEPTPAPPIPAPRILPFPKPPPGRPSVVRWVGKRSAVLAAACLLLALCSALFHPRAGTAFLGDTGVADTDNRFDLAMSRSGVQPVVLRANKPAEPAPSGRGVPSAGLDRLEMLNEKIDGLEQQGKLDEALALDAKAAAVARRANLEQHLAYAANRERVAVVSQKQGDLERACSSLCQAYEIRKKELGPDNLETAQTAQSLARACAVALHVDADRRKVFAKMYLESSAIPPLDSDAGSDRERKGPANLPEPLVQNPAVVEAMVDSLASNSPEARTDAANVLVRLGPQVRESLGRYVTWEGKDMDRKGQTHRLLRDVLKRIDQAQRDRLGIVIGPAASALPLVPLVGD
jgi:hypothetical protein